MPKFKGIDPNNVQVVNRVTLPLIKWEENEPRFVRIEGKIFRGKEVKGATKEGAKMEPADLANVLDLTTGELGQVIVGAVLKERITEAYPGDKYVGRCFCITQKPKPEGKRWRDYEVLEIAAPADLPPLDNSAAKASS